MNRETRAVNIAAAVATSWFWRERVSSFPCRMQRRPCFVPGAGSGRRTRRSRGTAGTPWWATSRSPGRRLCRPGSALRHCSPSQARPCRSPCSPCVLCVHPRTTRLQSIYYIKQKHECSTAVRYSWFLIGTKLNHLLILRHSFVVLVASSSW